MKLTISSNEYKRRTDLVLASMKERGLDAFIFWNSVSVFYLSGFAFIPTERPICMILGNDGKKTMFVPRLEVEHAQEAREVNAVEHYLEYKSTKHPMNVLAETLQKMGLGASKIASDGDGYSSNQGYRGPRLSQVLPKATIVIDRELIEDLRMVKSEEEIALIRESAVWGNLAHVYLQEYSKPGKGENEVSAMASLHATLAMMKTLGSRYDPVTIGRAGAHAGFRGQIGPNSALPHAMNINAVMRPGDVIVTGAGASIAGYNSELERTMFMGEPDAEKKKFFGYMKAVQEVAFENIKPGLPVSVVDMAVQAFYEKNHLWEYWRHHVGHAIGLLGHEAPFFDLGDSTIMRPGMVFSVEPGIFVMGLGGFRHSDTVLVTETGMEFITYYPRDLDSLICG